MQRHTSDRLYCLRDLDAMTLADWQAVPERLVPVDQLTPTQCCLAIDRLVDLVEGGARYGDDVYGHVVEFNGRLYIHDGHHDGGLRWLRGETHIAVRIVRIPVACTTPCCRDTGVCG